MRAQRSVVRARPEPSDAHAFALCTPIQALRRVLAFTMKYGKYDLHKSSANISVGTSYSWYYRKNDNPTTRKKKKLTRSASDSTLFSDYANQIALFEKEKAFRKKCKKSVSDVGKTGRVKYNPRNIKPVYMEPFTGNFFYGKTLPGYEYKKSEEKITYLPDSDAVTASESLTTAESLTTTAPTVVDAPELVRNPLYGCAEADVQIPTPEYSTDSTASKDSQLKSSSCTELRRTMCSSKNTEDILSNILKDYKRIMKEWNTTIDDHYFSVSHGNKRASTMCRQSNTDSYVPSLHSTLSCRKPSRCHKSTSNKYYHYAYSHNLNSKREIPKRASTLNRNQTFGNWSSTLQNFKKKTKFWKVGDSLSPSECKCLEAIYRDYDKRLQDWCDTISQCSTLISSGYKEEIEKPENQHLLPATLVGQADVLFGNLHELFTFHQDVFLKDLERSISATELVALCFVEKRETFFRLYSYYCQNIPRSERLRETLVDTHLFLQACQLRLGHKLPLAAYLLKPVQRITKYQLLLKDLLRYSECGSMSSNLQQALDCMLVVVKCVNDSMHQIAITGVPVDLAQQGELLMQGSFLIASESKRDLRLRIRPRRRHIFLYEKAMLFCKPATKNSHNKATYHFKNDLQMSQIGLTESVKGDLRKFEVWREHRLEVHTITAPSVEVKRAWVERIKRVLLDQLKELKGERVRKYGMQHSRTLIQASSWELGPAGQQAKPPAPAAGPRTASCDSHDEPCWSTDPSEDEEDEPEQAPAVGCALVALSEYTAVGASEVSLREGQQAELLKVGCAGWWYVRLAGGHGEGWAPAAYLDQRKTSRSSSRSHDRLHDH
ncbi:guanine nucleotide exchange factor DBS-like isoform X9 [Cydia pomonella]|uniref:guanine nucleotide exchange factor DBS-like isoform X9 n=1 Tax=Cydia pomonella TaxID=82600 RepID=UPI002ADDF26C|nr:guanine nucleotide exchange factor DBS-like isoform X9 [Cydia pomonella]